MRKIINRKPTEEMYNAGMNYLRKTADAWTVKNLFTVMFDAAPDNRNGCKGIEITAGKFSGCLGMSDCPVCEGK